jgi:hypothetical protein
MKPLGGGLRLARKRLVWRRPSASARVERVAFRDPFAGLNRAVIWSNMHEPDFSYGGSHMLLVDAVAVQRERAHSPQFTLRNIHSAG